MACVSVTKVRWRFWGSLEKKNHIIAIRIILNTQENEKKKRPHCREHIERQTESRRKRDFFAAKRVEKKGLACVEVDVCRAVFAGHK